MSASSVMGSPFLLQAWVFSLGKVSYSKGVLSKESKQNLSLRPGLPVADGVREPSGGFGKGNRGHSDSEGVRP
jgi:hypothetical protein